MSNTYDINDITSKGLIQAQNAHNETLSDTINFINGHLSATSSAVYDINNLVNIIKNVDTEKERFNKSIN